MAVAALDPGMPRSQNTVRTGCFARAGKLSAEEFACRGPSSARIWFMGRSLFNATVDGA